MKRSGGNMKMINRIIASVLLILSNSACASDDAKLNELVSQLKPWFALAQKAEISPWQYGVSNNIHQLKNTSPIHGGGALLYRINAKACAISIPHRFFDTHTYQIGKQLFNAHCQLLVHNTHHRYSDSIDGLSMDYSKRHYNLHNAAILAFQALHKDAKVIQVHGFNQQKRTTAKAKKADFIISQGKKGNVIKKQLTLCLSKLSKNSYFYPELVQELGGTKNILHTLNIRPYSFIHIEISKPMRKRLIEEQHLMSQFSECIKQII